MSNCAQSSLLQQFLSDQHVSLLEKAALSEFNFAVRVSWVKLDFERKMELEYLKRISF